MENRRQVERWERGALDLVRDGRGDEALALYLAHDRFHVEATPVLARERLVTDWSRAGDLDGAVMVARQRDDVADLNARARRLLRDSGQLAARETPWPGGAFAVGDRVVVKLNDFRLGVTNGERGTVVGLTRRTIDVQLRDRMVRLDEEFLAQRTPQGDPTLVHGYAITGHIAQGLTVDRAFVLADDGLSREWAYTAMSRGRLANHLYAAHEPEDPRAEFAPGEPVHRDATTRLATALSRSDEVELAIDVVAPDGIVELAHARTRANGRRREIERKWWRPGRRREIERKWWRPGRRRLLEAARHDEEDIDERIVEQRRRLAEQQHDSRRFVTPGELDDEAARRRERLVERRLEREVGHEIGRG
jgi:hypothetical protein